ncbi:TonB-dependent receptor [Pedobacter metabolipauper]|uniref:Outer membrane receptor for ferrienterochelin and colicins n=1 Tax=Pedobacter metabolipauper TaxID=425513 RepID=A0A4R6SSA2_9SPHI|nr:TonB-dependent receptor [Pedobacter metabolipauper]TDQ08255.1 outer membrane receptor for ferrienterochelin and colicins [Pedobacter metabolipauper]
MKRISIFLVLFLGKFTTLLAQEAILQGKISNSDGQVIAGATVTAGQSAISSSAKGLYTFRNLTAGKVVLKVKNIGYSDYLDTLSLSAGINTRNIILKKTENELENVNVSALKLGNRNAESLIKIENSIMPVTVIDRRTIELMGSRRLDEVVKEQTGIAIINDVTGGSRSVGVQMQGFGSEYVLVLLDGQPMVGRNGGNFDLSRISISNVERVEITKGAASLLYGGDALGGTINVITRHQIDASQAYASVNYGTNETIDVSVDGETPLLNRKGSIALNTNYYHTGGFNTSQGIIKGTTAPPYDNYAAQSRFRYRFNEQNLLSVMGRFGLRRSFMSKDFGVKYQTEDVLDEQDLNLSANFDHRFNNRWRGMTRYYFTRYHADMSVTLSQGDSISQSKFGQLLHRLEQQLTYTIPDQLDVITGFGGTTENIDENILSDQNSITAYFGYTQANWKVFPKLEITGGLRYDHIVSYGWRLDPSMALKYKLHPTLTVKAAYSTAFKAPDLRKQYQTFYNPSYNYIMVGSAVLRNTINQLRESGQVSQYELETVYDEIKGLALNAEMSKSYNFSVIWEGLGNKVRTEASVFYHDINNQINTVLVGRDISGNLIYSYRNQAKAYYQGAELSVSVTPVNGLQISGGYQYLLAKDRTIGAEIREGGKYNAPLFDPNTGYVNYTPSASDYWGIENRSKHMFNGRIFYTYSPLQLSANVRVNYRGQYAFSDKNNNGYMDRFDTFVRDHYLLNAGIEKKLKGNRMSVRLTAENLLNFVDQKVPSQPGRVFLLGLNYQFYKL